MSSLPPAKSSSYGLERSYIAWPATEATVQRWAGSIAVTLTSSCETMPSTVSLPPYGSAQNDAHSSTLPR
jgi:hypothetical protein